jgi:hypothetical protein
MPTKDILWPMRGVVRRETLRLIPDNQGPWPTPWAVNVRVEDPIERRLRGGSRPGLTKYVSTDLGAVIADMISVRVSSADEGASEILVVLVDSVIRTIENGVLSTPINYLTNESGEVITNEDDVPISIGEGATISSGFLVSGQQKVFAVTSSGISKFDPKTGQLEDLETVDGTIPTDCTFGAMYRDRLCMSGQDNAIYMSRQGVYGDFYVGADVSDQQRALAFQLSLSSDVGAAPTAMIPCMDAYLICATSRSLWVVKGDPAGDGTLQRISETIGIIGSKAWVKIDSTIVFLGRDGLYQIQTDGSGLKPLSDVIPDELQTIIVPTTVVSMGYDSDRPAFHIYLRTAGGSDTHWMYELATESFWPMRLQDSHSPRVVCRHAGELLLGSSDGYVRKITGDNDDGAAIQSHVVLGPIRLGTRGNFGRMLNMHAMLAAGSGRVNWRIITGRTAEEAADNAKTAIEAFQSGTSYSSLVKGSGNWKAGRSIMVYPRVRAIWCCIWLQSTDAWAFEGLLFNTSGDSR